MSSNLRKIVLPTPHRKRTPLFDWIRKKLLYVERDQPAGLPGPNGECVYIEHTRFPDTQSSRSPDLPKIPGGVYHKLADNYYYNRDARRQVEPPVPLVKNGHQAEGSEKGEKTLSEYLKSSIPSPSGAAVQVGPRENFGLKQVTPGFGYVWKREVEKEEKPQREDPTLRFLEKYDNYRK